MASVGAQFTFNGQVYKVTDSNGPHTYASKIGKRGRPSKFTTSVVDQLIRDTGTNLAEVFSQDTENQVGQTGPVIAFPDAVIETPVTTNIEKPVEDMTLELQF